jgi:hypothetical protein
MSTILEVLNKIGWFDKQIDQLPVGSYERIQLINAREPLVAWLRFKYGGKP